MADHDHTYVVMLAAALELATEFRIPCPGHPYSHLADLRVTRRTDGHGNGWALLNDDNHAWTGTRWLPLSALAPSDIYRYDRQTALDEATRIAPLETVAFQLQLNRLRAEADHR